MTDPRYQAAAEAFMAALGASADYVVEVHQQDASIFRQQLQALSSALTQETQPYEYVRTVQTFGEYLRGYQEKAHQHLQRMRREMTAAQQAVEAFASTVATDGADYEKVLKQEFASVEDAVAGTDLGRIRIVVHSSMRSLTTGYEALRNTHNLAIAQMRDEIRALQTALDGDRSGLSAEKSSIWEKHQIEARLKDLLRRDRPFSMIVAGVGQVARLVEEYSRPLVDHVLKETLVALSSLVNKAGNVGGWEEGIFVAIMEGPPESPLALALKARENLSGRYILRQNGVARVIRVEAQTRTVNHTSGSPANDFYTNLNAATKQVTL